MCMCIHWLNYIPMCIWLGDLTVFKRTPKGFGLSFMKKYLLRHKLVFPQWIVFINIHIHGSGFILALSCYSTELPSLQTTSETRISARQLQQ